MPEALVVGGSVIDFVFSAITMNQKTLVTTMRLPTHIFCRSLCAAALVWGVAGSPALAACATNNTQCEASNGLPTFVTGMTFASVGAGESNAAMVATNGSFISAADVTLNATSPDHHAGFIGTNSAIAFVTPTITAWHGLRMVGGLGNLNMRDGTLSTTRGGVFVTGNLHRVTLSNMGIMSGGDYGVQVSDGGGAAQNNLTITGGAFTHHGMDSHVGAVDFFSGGGVQVEGTTVNNTGSGHALRVGSSAANAPAGLRAKGGFAFETLGHASHGVHVGDYAYAELENGSITTQGDDAVGIMVTAASQASPLFGANLSVTTHGAQAHGVQLDGGYSILVETDIMVHGDSVGILAQGNGTELEMELGSIDAAGENAVAVRADAGSWVNLYNLSISSLNNTTAGGAIQVRDGAEVALSNNINVLTQGSFAPAIALEANTQTNTLNVFDSTVTAQDASAIRIRGGKNEVNLFFSDIKGERLIAAGNNGSHASDSEFSVYGSTLSGHIDTAAQSKLVMTLASNSVWTLRPSAAGDKRSTLSQLDLVDSAVVFDPAGRNLYQELVINQKPGQFYAYYGNSGARITFNTLLNTGGAWSNQWTDRLLINGDVSAGSTTQVHIQEVPGSPGGLSSPGKANLNSEGISLIQVSGNASENSFVLAGGYVTMAALPYEYRLYAYGPGSANGAADASQRQVDGTNHWDFRLQSDCLGGCASAAMQVVPQVANYLSAPTALFQAGLQDVGSLRERLGELRSTPAESREFFLRGHGGDYRYRSNLTAEQYGYDADIQYRTMQGGGNLYGVQHQAQALRFGLAAAYGNLAFTPNRAGSSKTRMNLWSATPYLSWRHDTGAYLDVLVSAGRFNGLVTTPARGRTARLQGRRVATSVQAGIPFALGGDHWSVEPQLQLTHQKLRFKRAQDVDNFAVNLGAPTQTTVRAGAVVTKQFVHDASAWTSKVYGKLHVLHSVNDKNKAWFGDDFEIGRTGTQLQTGLGAQVSVGKLFNVYGEANWKQRLKHGGTTGFSFNFGLNKRF